MEVESRNVRVAGRRFREPELELIAEIVAHGEGQSRTQLMREVCERLDWRRPTGVLKVRECRDLLERMEEAGWVVLPAKRRGGRPRGSRTRVPHTVFGEPRPVLEGRVDAFGPLALEPVTQAAEHEQWRELVGRYHALGYRMPYGAQLRYLAYLSRPERAVVAALQLSSAAWRLAARDHWIGWDEETRAQNLPRVVNNSRFLVLPWVRVKNLASHLLSRLARRVAADWQARFGTAPLLLETLVDPARYRGTCYRAANWLEVGETAGRGRMDRAKRYALSRKRVLLYPLVPDAARRLREA